MEPKKVLNLSLIGQQGLNSDIAPWELPAGFITFGINFRVFAGSISSFGGYQNWGANPVLFNPGYALFVSGGSSGGFWLIAGRTGVYVFDGANWDDISSTEGYAGLGVDDELLWTGCMMGQIPVINNPQAHPEYWPQQSVGIILEPLPFSPTQTWAEVDKTCKIIRSHQGYLFALNLQEGVDELPSSYRWSHPADANSVPFTWDETDPSALAGMASLGGDSGVIVDAQSLRDGFCIYSENATNILTPTGDEFVWRRRELSSTIGLISTNCVAEVKGKHFFLADGDIIVNDGNSIQSIIHDRLRKRLTAQASGDYYNRSFVVRNTALKEIWFCVPENGAQYPNTVYIYNWRDDSWAIRDLPYAEDTSGVVTEAQSFAAYGPQAVPSEAWDDWAGDWDSGKGTWGGSARTPSDNTVISLSNKDSKILIVDARGLLDSGDINTRIDRTNFPLEGHGVVTTITRIYPHIIGTQPVRIQFGSQDFAGAPVRWKPPVDFTPGVDRKVDIRTTGELHAWRIESIGSGTWSMSGMDIEYTPAGKR